MLVVSATNCKIKYAFPTEIRRSSNSSTAASFIHQSNAAYAIPAHPHLELTAQMFSSIVLQPVQD